MRPAGSRDHGEEENTVLLVLDVGNTNIHLGVYRGEKILATWDLSNRQGRRADELALTLKSLLRDREIARSAVKGAAVACVVPTVAGVIEEALRRTISQEPFFVGHESGADLLKSFDDPWEVGADRIANAAGGFHRYGGPLIVVDFGTATTFDAISGEGDYLGGVIAPGIGVSVEALFRKAARLPRIELFRPDRAVGRNTVASMQSGIIFGYAGLVEALVARIREEIGADAKVVATGGMAELIVRETGTVGTVDEHLTLEGLRLLYERERANNG